MLCAREAAEGGQGGGLPAAPGASWPYHTRHTPDAAGERESCLDHEVTQLAKSLSLPVSFMAKRGEVLGQCFLRGV